MVHLLAQVLLSIPGWLHGRAGHSPAPDLQSSGGVSTAFGALLQPPGQFVLRQGGAASPPNLSAAPESPRNSDGKPIPAAERKLRKAAQEFEAQLITAFWQSLHQMSLTGEEGSNDDPGHDTLDQMSIQAMANALATHGGFGISELLVKQLLPRIEADPAQGISAWSKL
jgi:hypothetical protein